jgi:putative spermidine/putrescine transport system ATP-binding protein
MSDEAARLPGFRPWRRRPASVSLAADRAQAVPPAAGVPIAIRGLVQSLGSTAILHGIDLDVQPGEFLTLLGASGSGKTTLLMALAGFVLPDRGRIVIGDEDVTVLAPHRRDIGIVFQSYALFPHMSVGRNIAYPLKLRGVPREEIARRVRQTLALVHLEGFEDRAVASLSGGQRQRVAVARAIVFRPRILLMDEPLSALDKPLREAMQIELRRLHADLGLTTIYVTHDQREAMTLSDRIAVMHAGRIAQIGTPKELYDRPRSAFVARFLGDSTILTVDRRADGLFVQGQSLPLDIGDNPAASYGLLIRPERLRLLRPGDDRAARQIVLSGVVADVIYEGGGHRLQVALNDTTMLAVRDASLDTGQGAVPRRGAAVDVALSPEDAVLVTLDT